MFVTPDPEAIDDDARDRVVVEGPDALAYLHSQVSQNLLRLAVGDTTWTLVLDPTGKVVSLARVRRTGEERFELDTDAGFGAPLLARLDRFRIRVDATTSLVEASNAEPADVHEAARVAYGWPRMGHEIVPGETIPATTGVVPVAVDFAKGCYPGQELVERMDSRGAHAPNAIRIVDVAPGAAVGDPVHEPDGSEVGTITSVSPDGSAALALVRRGADVGRPPVHLR